MKIANVNTFATPIIAQRQNALAEMARQPSPYDTAGGGDMETRIYSGLVQRGLPPHVAQGFVMNMRDESGLNPGINEAAPIVPGSRGGFGLYQLTGPRRVAYESYAAQRGVSPDDVDAQLDFLMEELRGSERSAADAIFATSTPGEAGAAIVNRFLRPAEEHRASRARRYLGGGGDMRPPAPASLGSLADLFSFFGVS